MSQLECEYWVDLLKKDVMKNFESKNPSDLQQLFDKVTLSIKTYQEHMMEPFYSLMIPDSERLKYQAN